ncbi:MAG: ORF6N domain-containing protein [Bacteroidales bacterium]|nr:ORF6N domain-containing protein [Bacteroidales bacterium]
MNKLDTDERRLMPALMKLVEEKIIVIRNQKVLLDRDVAEIYGVETKRVNEAVRNNPLKFREGYVFILTSEETSFLRTKKTTIEPVEGKGHYSKYNYLFYSYSEI